MVAHTYNPSTQEVQAGGSKFRKSPPTPQFKVSLSYMRLGLKEPMSTLGGGQSLKKKRKMKTDIALFGLCLP